MTDRAHAIKQIARLSAAAPLPAADEARKEYIDTLIAATGSNAHATATITELLSESWDDHRPSVADIRRAAHALRTDAEEREECPYCRNNRGWQIVERMVDGELLTGARPCVCRPKPVEETA